MLYIYYVGCLINHIILRYISGKCESGARNRNVPILSVTEPLESSIFTVYNVKKVLPFLMNIEFWLKLEKVKI